MDQLLKHVGSFVVVDVPPTHGSYSTK